MKKNKLKLIETYVYAKTLNLISEKAQKECPPKQMVETIDNASLMSKILLDACEYKIKSKKMDDSSFCVLKQQLESVDLKNSTITKYLKICEMIKNYNKYLKIAIN